jgi:hypothetical protein
MRLMFLRNYYNKYKLKAATSLLIWAKVLVQLLKEGA